MQIKKRFHGIVVPLVTPLTEKNALDPGAVERIIENITRFECMPFILGTTGEASSMPDPVKYNYIRKAASLKGKYQALYAGIGTNCLQDSIDLAKRCFSAGVDVAVATLPSYYSLTERQMMNYFEQLADGIEGPLMIYNIPATTHMSIPLELIDKLSHHENIVGIKDSERSEERLKQSLELWSRREDFSYFLGWAAKSAEALANGCDGIVPSTGNINPSVYFFLNAFVEKEDMDNAMMAQQLSDQIGNLYQTRRTLGESLAALKLLMHSEGLCEPWMMPPLERLSATEETKLKEAYAAIIS